jgi:hypothetical protein
MSHTKEPIHLTNLLSPYKGKWVALSHDETRVVGAGVTLDEALEAAKKKGEEKPVIIKSPDEHSALLL